MMLRECKVMAARHQLVQHLAPCLVKASLKQRVFSGAWHLLCNSKSIKLTVVINNNSNQASQGDHSSNKRKEPHPWEIRWELRWDNRWDSSRGRTLARLLHSSMISLNEIERDDENLTF